MSRPRETCRVRAFAERAGVTVKTLRHYDRLGLLRPARTPAGHRVYSHDDLDRLRRIRALKEIGGTLADMRTLLDADPALGFAADLRLLRELHEGFARAWRDRGTWPETIRRRFEDYRLDEVCAFVRKASLADFNRRAASA